MLAKDLISDRIPFADFYEKVSSVLEKMTEHNIFHLPVLKNAELLGVIAKSDIENSEDNNLEISQYSLFFKNNFVQSEQHFLHAIQSLLQHNLSIIPVVNASNDFLGSILTSDLLSFFEKFVGLNEPGGLISLEMHSNDYVLNEIAQIVESNDAKILSLYVSNVENSHLINVTLKLNTADLSPIIQTFERYKYKIKYKFSGDNSLDNLYNERMNEFLKYLNV